MIDLIQTAAVAIALFAATNLDDIFVLVGFYATGKIAVRQVVAGQYIGIGLLVGVSLIAALVALVIPPAWLGLLGLAPIALGIKALVDRSKPEDEAEEATSTRGSAFGHMMSVAAVTIANGGDNIGVYTPMFATQPVSTTAITLTVFAIMTAVWCFAGYWMVHHPLVGAPIRRWGPRVTPFVLIALGLCILYEADTISLLR